jgi:hypothetical protein
MFRPMTHRPRHCEERSDEAIQNRTRNHPKLILLTRLRQLRPFAVHFCLVLDCFAPLAMTVSGVTR